MLQFIGNGSAFNTKRINNSAFIKQGEDLLLIDCGETVFTELKEQDLLKDVKNLRILITHFHPDHVGSLGSLIFYAHFILKIHPIIYSPIGNINRLLERMGVSNHIYTLDYDTIGAIELPTIGLVSYEAISVDHVQNMESCAFKMLINTTSVYYSGDCSMIPKHIIDLLNNSEIEFFYQDTCTNDYPGNVHLSLTRLSQLIRQEYRHKVWCMHLDEACNEDVIKELGFNVTKQYRN